MVYLIQLLQLEKLVYVRVCCVHVHMWRKTLILESYKDDDPEKDTISQPKKKETSLIYLYNNIPTKES